MKTAISVPDPIFHEGERYAQRTGKSRSKLYSEALAEYLSRHGPDEVTEAMNHVVDSLNEPVDPIVIATASRVLAQTEW